MRPEKLAAAIEMFRQYDPEMPAQTILTFLLIAANPGVSLSRLSEELGIVLSSVSRNVYKLSRIKIGTEPGLDLVLVEPDPTHRSRKIATLTPKGQRFYDNLKRLITD